MKLKNVFKKKKNGSASNSGHDKRNKDSTTEQESASMEAARPREEVGNGSSAFQKDGSGAFSVGSSSSNIREIAPTTRPLGKSRASIAQRHHRGVPESFAGMGVSHRFNVPKIQINPALSNLSHSYDAIPELDQITLPRGGISIETKAVGRVQYGIPPETIKDSMLLGIPVPQIYIVPAERFCREMGPALGVNLAEFEFPAYFNFFVYKKRCTLVVDSQDAQEKICSVFGETLLGPAQFRGSNPIAYNEEDFAPDFPRETIPNFQKELEYFRIMPDGSELTVETLLDFCHFKMPREGHNHVNLAVPPPSEGCETFTQGSWHGDVATVWPPDTTEKQKKERSVPRIEIFKMASGLEYVIHDIDENNHIIGKARFSGHIKVSEIMSVEGFGGFSIHDDLGVAADAARASQLELPDSESNDDDDSIRSMDLMASPFFPLSPPTFHPPSFGVTTLGNSHGFDKNGSTSGYVLWVNGRGIMIDPPPYSSATLEKEGIRPRTIVGIILTHCHADHDAGAFQKVLTGSPVVVITTPTIYKSFIRKYAALASVRPALLRHCHRYKPATIGEALRFQGANFHFQYSLHSIPCLGFRVDWRGRSIVFSGDHMNKPDALDKLQTDGVLTKARADDLRNLPLQETDLLLHEAGAPPIHTPLEVLSKLPQRVKKRLYVVHTATIPEEYDLKVAPTGTAGTLRLDTEIQGRGYGQPKGGEGRRKSRVSLIEDDEFLQSQWSNASNEYNEPIKDGSQGVNNMATSFAVANINNSRSSLGGVDDDAIPLVGLRPASSTDAWFVLNLLSAVPFMSSLSYAATMEVLETARVEVFGEDEIVIESRRRKEVLCVVWEGTCVERPDIGEEDKKSLLKRISENNVEITAEDTPDINTGVWHAGDWTGPIELQPDRRLSGESDSSETHDIVAKSSQGVKVITIEFSSLHLILKSSSTLYKKYLRRRISNQERRRSLVLSPPAGGHTQLRLAEALKNLNIIELIDQNFALRKLSAVQKRHVESLAVGPIGFEAGERLWRDGAPVEKAFLIVSGTASFVPKRRNAGSTTVKGEISTEMIDLSRSTSDKMFADAAKVADGYDSSDDDDNALHDQVQLESLFTKSRDARVNSMTEANDFAELSKSLKRRAEIATNGSSQSEESHYEWEEDMNDEPIDPKARLAFLKKKGSVRARFENKVLGRLNSQDSYTGGLIFSRGHFLGDISKMLDGHVNPDSYINESTRAFEYPSGGLVDRVIQEQDSDEDSGHSSTLIAGKDGCVVLEFDHSTLIPFLDEYPGLLLSLLGTQVVV